MGGCEEREKEKKGRGGEVRGSDGRNSEGQRGSLSGGGQQQRHCPAAARGCARQRAHTRTHRGAGIEAPH